MPAWNSMANQAKLLNSGLSSGPPSLILPYREQARKMMKTRKKDVISMYAQPRFLVMKPTTAPRTSVKDCSESTPHKTNASVMAMVTQKTAPTRC